MRKEIEKLLTRLRRISTARNCGFITSFRSTWKASPVENHFVGMHEMVGIESSAGW
jgi:hypothetical protein